MKPDLVDALRKEAKSEKVTLLFSAKNAERNNAVVLKEVVEMQM
jgi:uncharacterized protein YeaO (DUF488 family)